MLELAATGAEVGRWLLASALAALAVIANVSNTIVPIRYWRTGKAGSTIPIAAGLLGASALLLAPIGTFAERRQWIWAPLLVDWTIPYLALWALRRGSRILRSKLSRGSDAV